VTICAVRATRRPRRSCGDYLAGRKAGQILAADPDIRPGRPVSNGNPESPLETYGINKKRSSTWQRLACHTQQEIADAVGVTKPQVNGWIDGFSSFGNLADSAKPAAEHADGALRGP
jgi:hypothetical protein